MIKKQKIPNSFSVSDFQILDLSFLFVWDPSTLLRTGFMLRVSNFVS